MAEIRLAKTLSGDMVIGVDSPEKNGIKDVAAVQLVPSSTGNISIAILPFGFPFEDEIGGFLANDKLLYEINKIPEELKNKYTEAKSNIRIAQSNPADGKIIL
ncbi:MAG: hypothetical protein IJD28_04225 [Deferribacterales bacterium]|nr:hypothetical protein [Deferribacterales bacterium]